MFSGCKQGTDLLYQHAKFVGARISRATKGQKSSVFWGLFFVCLSCFQITKFVNATSPYTLGNFRYCWIGECL